MNRVTSQRGNTLIGLLVSLLLGMMVLLTGMVLLQKIKQHAMRQHHLMQMWQHAMMIERLLVLRAQQAGVNWCVPLLGDLRVDRQVNQVIQAGRLSAIQIFELPQQYRQKLRRVGSGQAVKESPVLLFRFIEPSRLMFWQASSDRLSLPKTPKIKTGDQLVIANCQHWSMQLVKSVTYGQRQYLTFGQKITRFVSGSLVQIGLYRQVAYYIGKTGRKGPGGRPILALYALNPSGVRQELVPGIASWSLSFILADQLVQVSWTMQSVPNQRPLKFTILLPNVL